jgi:predicted glycoside hydrolase/deacetylase ChbG (UPF0249 family)
MANRREIVVHLDDVGNCHGSNVACAELFAKGAITSAAVMVPCPWWPEFAALAKGRDDWDLGVHLTLTAEFPPYRWRPLTGVSDNGLTDADGFMWRDVASARRADPAAVERELRMQIDTALASAIDVTHLDSHMGTAMMPELVDIYLKLGAEYRLPIFLPRAGFDVPKGATREGYDAVFATIVKRNNPDFGLAVTTQWPDAADPEPAYRQSFAEIDVPLTWGAYHATAPGEIEDFSWDSAIRIAEYELFRTGRMGELMAEAGLTPVGMRAFREKMRRAQ